MNVTYSQTNANQSVNESQQTDAGLIFLNTYLPYLNTYLPIIISGVIGGVLTYFVAPRVKENFRLREDFYVDYKKWCTTLCGELSEYKFLSDNLDEWKKDSLCSNYNYLLTHFWELHNCISRGHKYLGKIYKKSYTFYGRKKKERQAFKDLLTFVHEIDARWHELENLYPEWVGPLSEKQFRCLIKSTSETQMKEMGQQITKWIKFLEKKYNFNAEYRRKPRKIDVMRELLEREIP